MKLEAMLGDITNDDVDASTARHSRRTSNGWNATGSHPPCAS